MGAGRDRMLQSLEIPASVSEDHSLLSSLPGRDMQLGCKQGTWDSGKIFRPYQGCIRFPQAQGRQHSSSLADCPVA